MKRILTKEEVYGCSVMAENLIDDKYVYYDDLTCIEIQENDLIFYKLVNPFSIDIPIYKMKKVLHREDGPAHEHSQNSDTILEWYIDGKYHRLDGPAYEKTDRYGNEYKSWYKNGKRHREDGPAEITPKSTEYWNRLDGPAFEDNSNQQIIKQSWYVNGLLHREDGPAIVITIGEKLIKESYYINGQLHRENGPAETKYESKYTTFTYCKNGVRHRTDGPAYIDTDKGDNGGCRKYYVNGVNYKTCDFWWNKILKKF